MVHDTVAVLRDVQFVQLVVDVAQGVIVLLADAAALFLFTLFGDVADEEYPLVGTAGVVPAQRNDEGGNPVPFAVAAKAAVFGGDFHAAFAELLADVAPDESGEEAFPVLRVDEGCGYGVDIAVLVVIHGDHGRVGGVDKVGRIGAEVDFVDFGIRVAQGDVVALFLKGAFLFDALLLRDVPDDEKGGHIVAFFKEKHAVFEPQLFVFAKEHPILIDEGAGMRAAGLEQGFGRGGAVDAFAVGGMDHRYCFGVECAVVAGTGFAGQARRGGVAVELPRAQVDFDDAVPDWRNTVLDGVRAGRRFLPILLRSLMSCQRRSRRPDDPGMGSTVSRSSDRSRRRQGRGILWTAGDRRPLSC